MSSTSDKLVSVVTPAFNAANDIERAVHSVAAQSLKAYEHIVIDDGSSDDTFGVLERLQAEFDHLLVIRQQNRGAAAARNAGIELAQSRYIAFLDSDDEWRPDKLSRQITFMRENDNLFSYGDYLRCEDTSRRTIGAVFAPDQLCYEDFLRGCPIGCLTVAYDQKTLGKVFMPEVRRGHDWGLWLALTRNGVVARRYPGVEAVYSVKRDSLSGAKLHKMVDVYRIYRRTEGLSCLRSLSLLAIHSINSVRNYRGTI